MSSFIERFKGTIHPERNFFLKYPKLEQLTVECAGAWGETSRLSVGDQLRVLVKAGTGIIQAIWGPNLKFPEGEEEDFGIPREVRFFLPGNEWDKASFSYNFKPKTLEEWISELTTDIGGWDETLRFLNRSHNDVIKKEVGKAISRIVGLAGGDDQKKSRLVHLAVETMHDLIVELSKEGVDLDKFHKIFLLLVPQTQKGNMRFMERLGLQ